MPSWIVLIDDEWPRALVTALWGLGCEGRTTRRDNDGSRLGDLSLQQSFCGPDGKYIINNTVEGNLKVVVMGSVDRGMPLGLPFYQLIVPLQLVVGRRLCMH